MDLSPYIMNANEKPLDRMPISGGFTGIFRTVACVGDSLSSGEFETRGEGDMPGYHDMFEYSWGQYIAREAGVKVYNFSRGGLTAAEYRGGFADRMGFWDKGALCQAYILALGVNDMNSGAPLGSMDDIRTNYYTNAATFTGDYAHIIQRYKALTPCSRFFLMTMPRTEDEAENEKKARHAERLHEIARYFRNTYVIDFFRYAPVYDKAFRDAFFLHGHMNAQGYMLTARMVMSYIDFLVRAHPGDFSDVPFIGTPFARGPA